MIYNRQILFWKKKVGVSTNLADDNKATWQKESSLNDSVSKAGNCGIFIEGLQPGNCVAILCYCVEIMEEAIKILEQK